MTDELKPQNETEKTQDVVEQSLDDIVQADIVEIYQGGANKVQANEVTFRQAGANHVQSDLVQVRQGGIVAVDAEKVEVLEGAILFAESSSLEMTASRAVVIVNEGNATLDQCGNQVLITKGNVDIDQSGIVALVANNVTLENNNSVVFLLAKNVEGDVQTKFGPRESALFGILAGLTAGALVLAGALFGKKRTKKK